MTKAFNFLVNQAQHPSMAPRTRTLTCSNCRSSSNTSCLSWENVVIASCLIGSLPLIMFLRMWPLAKAFVGAGWSSFGRMKLTNAHDQYQYQRKHLIDIGPFNLLRYAYCNLQQPTYLQRLSFNFWANNLACCHDWTSLSNHIVTRLKTSSCGSSCWGSRQFPEKREKKSILIWWHDAKMSFKRRHGSNTMNWNSPFGRESATKAGLAWLKSITSKTFAHKMISVVSGGTADQPNKPIGTFKLLGTTSTTLLSPTPARTSLGSMPGGCCCWILGLTLLRL